jgi:hypothetical protein
MLLRSTDCCKFYYAQKIITIFIFMRRTQKLHATSLQIELHKFFLNQNSAEEMFFEEQEMVIGF